MIAPRTRGVGHSDALVGLWSGVVAIRSDHARRLIEDDVDIEVVGWVEAHSHQQPSTSSFVGK